VNLSLKGNMEIDKADEREMMVNEEKNKLLVR
jgi:hypothetical protein